MGRSKASGKQNRADAVIDFFRRELKHTKGRWAGRPFELLPWQEEIVRALFGTVGDNGKRQHRTAYISIPRKAGKSTMAAAMALTLLLEGEPGGEVYSAAADRDQAGIVFEQAKAMIEASPRLSKEVEIFKRALFVPRFGATYKVLSADAPTKHGLNAHGVIFDELHAQPNRELWDVLTTSVGAREQPLIVAITTAGYNRESICYEMYNYARRVASGAIEDPSFFSCVFEAGEDDDWQDETVWQQANPSLGETVPLDYYRQEYLKAQEITSYQNTFRRLYLNQWVQQHSRWIDLSLWDEQAGMVNEDALAGRTCYGGLDLASVSDLVAWVMVFPRDDDPEAVDVVARHWCPEDELYDSGNRYRSQYQAWAKEGWLQTTPGRHIDYAAVKRQILNDAQKYRIKDLNVDRLFQAHQLAGELEDEGLTVIGMGQGFLSMAAPMKSLERLLLARKIRHGGNPLLRWQADNVSVKMDPAGNLKPDKAASQGKIDGIVALTMALDRVTRHVKPSIYETRGVRSV